MTLDLAKVDWNAIGAVSTFLAVLIALFYQPFLSRRRVIVSTSLTTTEENIHVIYLTITNAGEKPIWIVSAGILFEDGDKRVVSFLHGEELPRKLEPTEVYRCPSAIMHYNYKIKDVFAKDSLGKFWNPNRKNKRDFKKSIQICKDHNPPLFSCKPMKYVERPRPKTKP